MIKALASGLIGAVVLTLVHESARKVSREAPRVDLLGEQAIAETLETFNLESPPEESLYGLSLTGDLASNALYYSLVGAAGRENAVLTGAVLGAVAGLGTVFLPGKIGLDNDLSAKTTNRAVMTIAWYTLGGLAAGFAYNLLDEDADEDY